jgi:anaphase-promoting complex subunit 2
VGGTTARFERDIHAAFAHSLPHKRFSQSLSYILYDAGCRLFRFYNRQDGVEAPATPEPTGAVRDRMTILLMGLERVGLGGDHAQKAFAHAMNALLDTFISSHYLKVDWYAKRSVVPDLMNWIENGFVPLVELVMECLRCDDSEVESTQLRGWQEMGLVRLGRARVEELFNFVICWDRSLGAILDLKEYLKLDGAKEHLKARFSRQVSRRLLHPGVTTTYILNVYISIIRAFHRLEPRGVLLQSVTRPIRRYLKEREDTARIIISSLLIDVDDENSGKYTSSGDLSYEIASEMSKPFAHTQAADDEFNWTDMNWQPLPHDASPEYKKSKVEDVIYFLLTLWDRDDFINELKNILGDHLLRCQDLEYQKEIRLLELIKIRLGEDKLQACEVMLRDVLESRRINDTICITTGTSATQQEHPQSLEGPGPRTPQPHRPGQTAPFQSSLPTTNLETESNVPTLNAQILSSFFWPILRDDEFRVPKQIESLQKNYESRFERIKGMRKLRWMNALGDSTITLEFEDRREEFGGLTMWQVSVIYAFQPQEGEEWIGKGTGKSEGITRNVGQLEEVLDMDEGLVRQALAFWVGKSVLRLISSDTYTVIERLGSSTTADDNAAAAASELAEVQAAQTTTVKSQADLLNERKDVYMSFIVGMLTNQGNLGVQRILIMMRMMVQGGFPFGPEEVRGLLGEMESGEKVVGLGGDVWGIRKG